jgi:hypothetical protein
MDPASPEAQPIWRRSGWSSRLLRHLAGSVSVGGNLLVRATESEVLARAVHTREFMEPLLLESAFAARMLSDVVPFEQVVTTGNHVEPELNNTVYGLSERVVVVGYGCPVLAVAIDPTP